MNVSALTKNQAPWLMAMISGRVLNDSGTWLGKTFNLI